MEYNKIYGDNQRYITMTYRDNSNYPVHKRLFRSKQIKKYVDKQPENTDLFISKYPLDHVITSLIFDFDDADDLSNTLDDAQRLRNFLELKGLNSVIIQSGSKGYHLYIQHQPLTFNQKDHELDVKRLFELYCENMTGGLHVRTDGKRGLDLTTLDETNTMAGLNGNIRVIGSVHPKTGNKCSIVEGEFKEYTDMDYLKIMEYPWECYTTAISKCKNEIKQMQEEVIKLQNIKPKVDFTNLVDNNDLRTLIPSLFGGEVKEFKDYILTNCIEHNDSNPSMIVTKEYFYCKTCGCKGNIWYLIKNGILDLSDFMVKSKGVQ